jgi:alkanesulfonate monooxygenase SsuD/methylene tetrahydromethanopterin reductase-like flavin-dependent oxidoreductase (luciferase family)
LLVRIAVDAEAAGWDGFFLQEVFSGAGPVVDPWIAIGAVALATHSIRLGVFLTPLPRRLPWEVARQVATVDRMSGGRLIFGACLGTEDADFAAIGLNSDRRHRAEQLDEGLQVVAGLCAGEPFRFTGEHYQIDGLQLQPTPVQRPRVPVWVAAGWPARRPLRRAAQWDGVYLMTYNRRTRQPLSLSELTTIREYLQAHRLPDRPTVQIAANGLSTGSQVQQVGPMAEAGVTWWIEWDGNQTQDDYLARIHSGPPTR